MSNGPGLSLIVNTFNQPDHLGRVLAAVARQTSPPDEVVLADDGSGDATRRVFAEYAVRQAFRAEHVWQAHAGFRRARILNQAVARSRGEYLVFLDGDSVPHPRFLADHRSLLRPGFFVQGHRAMIERNATAFFGAGEFNADRRRALGAGQLKFSGWKYAFRWPWPYRRERSDPRGIRGCNLAIWRADFVRVNGCNEAFEGWGCEDVELAVRLLNAGVRRLDVRGWALCYHLWHPPADRAGQSANERLLQDARVGGATRCERGLDRHLAAL